MGTVIRTPRDAGALVRDARTRRGMSQAALADRAGVSRQWIVQFERGKARAEIIVLLRVLDALGIELTASGVDGRDVSGPPAQAGADVSDPSVVDLGALLDEHVPGESGDD